VESCDTGKRIWVMRRIMNGGDKYTFGINSEKQEYFENI